MPPSSGIKNCKVTLKSTELRHAAEEDRRGEGETRRQDVFNGELRAMVRRGGGGEDDMEMKTDVFNTRKQWRCECRGGNRTPRLETAMDTWRTSCARRGGGGEAVFQRGCGGCAHLSDLTYFPILQTPRVLRCSCLSSLQYVSRAKQ